MKVRIFMNRITNLTIEGKNYNTATMSTQTLSEFVTDVNKTKHLDATLNKYHMQEVK